MPFEKGHKHGKGRPRGSASELSRLIKEKAENAALEALDVMIDLMHNAEKETVRLSAAREVFYIVNGKPVPTQDNNNTSEVNRLTIEYVNADGNGRPAN